MSYDPLRYQRSSTDEDLLPVVDENDVVIDARPRREVHLHHLLHRAVHIVVIDGAGRLLLQLRSARKDSHPGFWDISVGGHVDPGEEYVEAARRELREELGVEAPFREVARRAAAPDSGWEFVRIYECLCTGPFRPHPDEIDRVRWIEEGELDLFHPEHEDPDRRITGSGLISLRARAAAKDLP